MDQKEVFLAGEADCWFHRNREALARSQGDPVLASLSRLGVSPRMVLEIGCADGWRLEGLARAFGAACYGLEPSEAAVQAAARRETAPAVVLGTADALPFADAVFDCVILGFCLYLTDVRDHFRIAAGVDRVLADQGFLVIVDFLPATPHRNPYVHRPGLFSHKMAWQRMFSWSPCYHLLDRTYREHGRPFSFASAERVSVDVLYKDVAAGFPLAAAEP